MNCTGQEDCPCPDCVAARLDFIAWADRFNERWAAHKKANEELAAELHNFLEQTRTSGPVCKWGCNGDGQIFVSDGPDDGHLEPCECRITHITHDSLPCGNVLCPECGDVRDHSAVR